MRHQITHLALSPELFASSSTELSRYVGVCSVCHHGTYLSDASRKLTGVSCEIVCSLLCVYISQLIPNSDLCQHQLQKCSDCLERGNYSSTCDSSGMRDTVTNMGWESDPGLQSWPVTGWRSQFSLEETEVIDLDDLNSLQFAQTLQTSPRQRPGETKIQKWLSEKQALP